MIQLNTFRQMSNNDYDNNILQEAILEINNHIKDNSGLFRLLFEFESDSIESRLYKNALTGYYIKNGFKIVTYPTFLFIEWSRVTVNSYAGNPDYSRISLLGDHFTAQDLYFYLTNNVDLRKISYRVMLHYVTTEITKMRNNGISESKISFGVSSIISAEYLNNMFAPELKYLGETFKDVNLSFLDGVILRIRLDDMPEEYTDIPIDILYGSRPYL